jgi:hypothetical protein
LTVKSKACGEVKRWAILLSLQDAQCLFHCRIGEDLRV